MSRRPRVSGHRGFLGYSIPQLLVVVALVLAGCASAPAPSRHVAGLTLGQRLFYDDITAHVAALGVGKAASVSVGNSICDERAAGFSQRHVIGDQNGLAGGALTLAERTELVGLAEADLCGKYLPPHSNLHLSS